MKKQSFIYGMLMATSFLACENELPFRDKPQEPQLLMNAFLEAGKEKNEVFLHIVDGNGTTSFLEGAIIVYVNDEKTEETDVKGGSYMSKYTVQSRFCPGDRIRLETALEGGKYQGSADSSADRRGDQGRYASYATESRSFHAGLYALPDCHP